MIELAGEPAGHTTHQSAGMLLKWGGCAGQSLWRVKAGNVRLSWSLSDRWAAHRLPSSGDPGLRAGW
jgi:hypothetical protein